jgi:phospholipid/cholesterol/gamma-HCH transport system substrate-binding protein
MARESVATIVKRRLLGLTYLVVIFGLIALSVAIYQKQFITTVKVTLRTDHTGNQLLTESDVKERGIIVGSVRKVKSTGDGAEITLALDPGRVKLIPSNVSAQILPKTLFGEQYVALQLPTDPGPPIKGGDVISQDRSKVALETQRVLGDFLPLLQAVQPAELNATLTAIATALKGRGEKLGQTLTDLDAYLKQLNPQVPQLVDDLKKLGQFSDQLDAAAPDLLQTFDNFQTGARTVVEKQAALNSVLVTAQNTSDILNSFLAENQQRLITVVDTTDKVYNLLEAYTPEYQCMLAALTELHQKQSDGIRNDQIQLSAQLFLVKPTFGAYKPGEEPKFLTGLGPHCFGLPNPPQPFKVPANFACVNDGAALTDAACGQAAKTSAVNQQSVGSPQENALVKSILATASGTTPSSIPDVATLLLGPALRGEQVVVK